MDTSPLRPAVKLLLIALTLFIAASPPLTYALAWNDPAIGLALGIPSFGRLPTGTMIVAVVTILAESVLMVLVVLRMWRIVDSFTRGVFFTRDVVTAMRSVGRALVVIAGLRAIVLPVALATLWTGGRPLNIAHLWLQIFNLPAAILLCGLFALIMASAFERAVTMARESRFTV